MRMLKVLVLFLTAAIFVTACSGTSFKQESKETQKAVKEAWDLKTKKPNEKSKTVEFYLPFGFEIEEKSPNNIILKNGSKTYILFYNLQENESSKVIYEATVSQHKKLEVNQKYDLGGKFAYLLIDQLKEDKNEVTLGLGGVKLTTETGTSSMKEEAATMVKIVKSVRIKK